MNSPQPFRVRRVINNTFPHLNERVDINFFFFTVCTQWPTSLRNLGNIYHLLLWWRKFFIPFFPSLDNVRPHYCSKQGPRDLWCKVILRSRVKSLSLIPLGKKSIYILHSPIFCKLFYWNNRKCFFLYQLLY